MEHTPWKLPCGTYTIQGTSWNVHHEHSVIELTPWNVPTGTYTMEVF